LIRNIEKVAIEFLGRGQIRDSGLEGKKENGKRKMKIERE
jgi:hypothetical protein